MLGWLAGQTSKIRLGSAIFQMPGALAGDDRDDRRHDRPALRRADDPRHRLLRPAGRRGLARAAVRQAAAAHARVRRRRADGAGPRTRRVPRRDARAAAARRPGQGAEADHLPRAGADPDLPRRRSARRTPRWPARSPTAGSRPSSPPSTSRSCGRCCEEGADRAGQVARRLRHRPDRQRVRHRRPRSARATRCARSSPCTSAAWARASRTSTTSSSAATATRPRRKTIQDLYLDGKRDEAMAAIPDALIDTVSLCGPKDVVRERLAVYRDAGVGTLGVTPTRSTRDGAPGAAAARRRARRLSRAALQPPCAPDGSCWAPSATPATPSR